MIKILKTPVFHSTHLNNCGCATRYEDIHFECPIVDPTITQNPTPSFGGDVISVEDIIHSYIYVHVFLIPYVPQAPLVHPTASKILITYHSARDNPVDADGNALAILYDEPAGML